MNLSKDSILNSCNLCNLCNKVIDNSVKIFCDGCKNQFHELCLNVDGNSSNPDLVHLCKSCSIDGEICSPKNQSIKKSSLHLSIPILGGSSIYKSLRSRNVAIKDSINGVNRIKRKSNFTGKSSIPIAKSSICDAFINAKSIDSKYEKITKSLTEKVEFLETQLNSIGKSSSSKNSSSCIHCENFVNKIAELETIIGENRQLIENSASRFPQNNLATSTPNSQVNNVDEICFNIDFDDKIADLKRIMCEDRLLVEQLYVNQMNEIQKRIEIQEQTIKSCEALMEINATNDAVVNKQFGDIEFKLNKIGELMENHEKILHRLNDINKRHNNTLITHFDLNKAYCNDVMTHTQTLLHDLSSHTTDRCNDKRVKTDSEIVTQHKRGVHSNDAQSNHTQSHGMPTKSTDKLTINIQPLRIGHRVDYSRLQIHIRNCEQYGDEKEISEVISRALNEFSSKFCTHKWFVSGLSYKSNALIACSFIVVLQSSIHLNNFKRFLSCHGFQIIIK